MGHPPLPRSDVLRPGAIATVQDGYCEPFEHEITGALDDLDAKFAAEPAT